LELTLIWTQLKEIREKKFIIVQNMKEKAKQIQSILKVIKEKLPAVDKKEIEKLFVKKTEKQKEAKPEVKKEKEEKPKEEKKEKPKKQSKKKTKTDNINDLKKQIEEIEKMLEELKL